MPDEVSTTLRRVAAGLPGGGESRPGQVEMAEAVATAMAGGRNLVVQAGTGTGKSLAYLVPAALAGERVVVATATKALQDQLADKDLPLVAGATGDGLTFAVLKGRSNYVCRQRVSEIGGRTGQLTLAPGSADPPDADDTLTPASGADTSDPSTIADQVRSLVRWAEDSTTGDRAELPFEPHFRAWAMVSTTARECPGAFRCPSGRDCFAEDARARAADADVVVVNTHLYGAHLASGGAVLPEHQVVVFDEAHEVEDVMTDSLGLEVGPGRFRALATAARPVLDSGGEAAGRAVEGVADLADVFHRVLRPWSGRRVPHRDLADGTDPGVADAPPTGPRSGDDDGSDEASGDEPLGLDLGLAPPAHAPERAAPVARPAGATAVGSDPGIGTLLALASGRVGRLVDHLRRAEREAGDGEAPTDRSRRDRVLLAAGHLASDLARLAMLGDEEVAWVEDSSRAPALRVSPIDVGPVLAERLWGSVTGILTSATVPIGLAGRLGMPTDGTDDLDVGSPFDYRANSLLYVAASLPDRRRPESEPALHDELEILIAAAGGRTLALFTSWRAMRAAVEALTPRLDVPVLSQSDLPKPALVEAFRVDETACLFATLGFWQGVDVPGRTLSLVTIDRIPFPRPDDPVLEARRELAGPGAFAAVDLPRAGTLLAQGAGRLIRSGTDRGVVAVLDSRLATARYRGALLARVPPMKRTLDRDEVVAFLAAIAASADGPV
ncbi:MAG: ATP-dependent DNA helicase [Acidimicrobiales bacterium]|jgi:ATP-dependent DNA helicase DinG